MKGADAEGIVCTPVHLSARSVTWGRPNLATTAHRRRAAEQRDELPPPQCELHAILTVPEAAYPMGAGASAGLGGRP